MKTKKLLRSVGMKADLSQIPTGFYCYTLDNSEFFINEITGECKHIIKSCPYRVSTLKFKSENIIDSYCKLVKNKEPDVLLSDGCKICGIKMWSDDVTDI